MPLFEDLPFELISEILSITADLNARAPDTVTYSYGLSQAPRPLRNKTYIQKYVRGQVPTDVLRWNSVAAIRQVNSRWHEWALSHALKELYIRRWQGGETWMKRAFDNTLPVDMLPVVYQNPYKSVRSTAQLFHDFPALARHVRKIWFNGIYRFDTIDYVFKILSFCYNVQTATLPWTALRYGTTEAWTNVLSFPRLTSLEFLSVGLKSEICQLPPSHCDTNVLETLDFSSLRRLKIFGDSNLHPLNDTDLALIARTATNLTAVLITNVTTITAAGIAALVAASSNSLKLLEYSPLTANGFSPPPTSTGGEQAPHLCPLLASCPHLEDLAITLPSTCPALFANPHVRWSETVRIRIADPITDDLLPALLHSARSLLEAAAAPGLEIEIAKGKYLFDARKRLVHGGFAEIEGWAPPLAVKSVKGPYGYTGLYGGGMKGEWVCVGETEFLEAVKAGVVVLR